MEPDTSRICAKLGMGASDRDTTRTEMRSVCMDLSNSAGYCE